LPNQGVRAIGDLAAVGQGATGVRSECLCVDCQRAIDAEVAARSGAQTYNAQTRQQWAQQYLDAHGLP
jgi:hypothetical protein